MKKLLALLLSVAMLVAMTACAGTPAASAPAADTSAPAASAPAADTTAPAAPIKVAVVFASSGLGDKSFNDTLYKGMEDAEAALGFEWTYAEPLSDAEYEPMLRSFAEAGEYALIIGNGGTMGSAISAVAPDFPEQQFMSIDAEIHMDNVASFQFREQELGYMIGVLAANMTKSNILGFIAAMDTANCNRSAAGFIAGARSVNPDITVLFDYIGSFSNIAGAKEMAISFNQQGADVIYHNASLAGLGMIEASTELGFYAIGYNGNVNDISPDTVICSGVRGFDKAAFNAINSVMNGEWISGFYTYGLAEDGLVIVTEGSNITVDQAIWDQVYAAGDKIAAGEIVPPVTPADALN